jgi:hypothetical protein
LSVDILPTNANVTLDGLALTESMPIRLNNLTPHKYSFEISAPGYYSWKKEIEINKNQTTYIKEMIILKKGKSELLNKGFFPVISVSPSGRYVAYLEQQKTTNNTLCYIRDLTTNITTLAVRLPTLSPLKLIWNKKTDFVVLSSTVVPYTTFEIIDAQHPETHQNIVNINPEPITKFMWRNATEPELYYGTKTSINSYLPNSELSRQISKITFLNWYNENGTVWALTYNTSTNRLIIATDILGFTKTFASFTNPIDATSSSLTGWELLAVQGSSVLVRNNEQGQFLIVRDDKQYAITADTFNISPYNNWWLLTNQWELWTYSDGGEPSLLSRLDSKLMTVVPLDEYNTLALSTEKDVTALYPYYYIEQTLITKPVITMAAVIPTRTLYYSNEEGLWRINY